MIKTGELIRLKRRELKITQAELARKVGVTDGYIGKIEIGYQRAGLKTLLKIAEILTIPFEDMIDFDSEFPGARLLADKQADFEKHFKELHPKVKRLLLELVPILEKYV